jgi:hypothetical protein
MSEGPYVVTVESDELERSWQRAAEDLDADAQRASLAAADDAVRAMQERHPYTDRTYNLSGGMHAYEVPEANVGDAVEFAALIDVPADYASFVDQGTTRSKPYPFTPRGEDAAERTATREARAAVDRFEKGCKRDG